MTVLTHLSVLSTTSIYGNPLYDIRGGLIIKKEIINESSGQLSVSSQTRISMK